MAKKKKVDYVDADDLADELCEVWTAINSIRIRHDENVANLNHLEGIKVAYLKSAVLDTEDAIKKLRKQSQSIMTEVRELGRAVEPLITK